MPALWGGQARRPAGKKGLPPPLLLCLAKPRAAKKRVRDRRLPLPNPPNPGLSCPDHHHSRPLAAAAHVSPHPHRRPRQRTSPDAAGAAPGAAPLPSAPLGGPPPPRRLPLAPAPRCPAHTPWPAPLPWQPSPAAPHRACLAACRSAVRCCWRRRRCCCCRCWPLVHRLPGPVGGRWEGGGGGVDECVRVGVVCALPSGLVARLRQGCA